MTLTVEMLQAEEGDCLWIEYGKRGKTRTILIDGGTADTKEVLAKRIAKAGRGHVFELVVITHVDDDHIGGIFELIKEDRIRCRDLWFNSYDHLMIAAQGAAPGQGDDLTDLLLPGVKKKLFRWNHAFGGEPVFVPASGPLPLKPLAGGAKVILLSPSPTKALAMTRKWVAVTGRAGLRLGPKFMSKISEANEELGRGQPAKVTTKTALETLAKAQEKGVTDPSQANGSSIAFILEYEGKRILFAGDAHHKVLCAALARHSPKVATKLDACKLPHHGSRNNVSAELIGMVNCPLYLFSTSGAGYSHPDKEAVATVITHGLREDQFDRVQLAFNYDNEFTDTWKNEELQDKYKYLTRYPKKSLRIRV